MDNVILGRVIFVVFITRDAGGALADADATPAVVVRENGVDLGYSAAVSRISLGTYEAAIDTGAFSTIDMSYSARVSYAVSAVNQMQAIASFVVSDEPALLDDLAAVYVALLDTIEAPTSLPVGHAVTGTLSPTVITTDLSFADVDGAKDGLMLFTTGVLAGEPPKRIGSSTTGGTLTLKSGYAWSAPPANGDTFIIINR